LSNTVAINIGDIDKRFMPYIELNQELQRIESYKCPVPGCGFQTKQGPGAVRMHTVLCTSKSLGKDEKGEFLWAQTGVSADNPDGCDREAHLEYYKEHAVLSLEDVMMLSKTVTRHYAE
jgi:hypothetical protein